MKNILLLLFICLLPLGGQAQKSVRKFYRQVKKTEGNVKLSLPGFLIHMGAGIARKHVDDDPQAKLAMEMTKYIKNIKVVIAEDGPSSITSEKYKRFIDIARKKDRFKDLIMVKDGQTNVNIMIKGNEKKIKNILILVNDGSEFVMLSMKTSLKYKHLNQFLGEILKSEGKVSVMPKETKKVVKKAIRQDRA